MTAKRSPAMKVTNSRQRWRLMPSLIGLLVVFLPGPVRAESSRPLSHFIDLSSHFNDSLDDGWQHRLMPGNNLGTLSKGRQILGGVEFDVRGIVQLASTKLKEFSAGAR